MKNTLKSAAAFTYTHGTSSFIENLSYYNITNRIDFQCFKRIFLNRFFRTIIRRRTSTARSPDGSVLLCCKGLRCSPRGTRQIFLKENRSHIPLFCNLQTDISSQNPFIFRIAGIFLCQVLCIFTLYYIAFHVKQWYNNLRGVIVCTLRRASTKKETRHSFLLYKDTVLMGK